MAQSVKSGRAKSSTAGVLTTLNKERTLSDAKLRMALEANSSFGRAFPPLRLITSA